MSIAAAAGGSRVAYLGSESLPCSQVSSAQLCMALQCLTCCDDFVPARVGLIIPAAARGFRLLLVLWGVGHAALAASPVVLKHLPSMASQHPQATPSRAIGRAHALVDAMAAARALRLPLVLWGLGHAALAAPPVVLEHLLSRQS